MAGGQWQRGLAFSLVTVAMWGVLPLFLQSALKSMSPLSLNFYRFAGAATLLGFWLVHRKRAPKLRTLTLRTYLLLGLAVLGLAGNYAFYIYALEYVSPAVTQVVIQVAPVLLTVGSVLVFKESFSRSQGVGLMGLIIGLSLFFNMRWPDLARASGDYSLGVGLVVLAALTWVVYALSQKVILRSLAPPQVLVLIYAFAALLFAPFAEFEGFKLFSSTQWFVFAWCILNTLVAYGAFAEAMACWQSSRVSAVLSLVPLLTITSTFVAESYLPGYFIHEDLNTLSLVGAVLVVGGAICVALAGSRASRPQQKQEAE